MLCRLPLLALALPLLAAVAPTAAKADFLVGMVAYERHDYATALKEFSDPALAEVPVVQGYLGRLYFFGQGVERDPARGIALLEAAARGGDLDAVTLVAQAYDLGMGVEQDKAKALEFWRIGAEQGMTRAQVEVGRRYQTGEVTGRPDYDQAAAWLRQAAAKGDAQAMVELGWMAQNGLGMPADEAAAAEYYRRAANKGQPLAMDRLARMMLEEGGDLTEARNLAETAVRREGQPAFHDTLGSILLQQGELAAAEEQFKLAAKKSPLYAAAREHLGDLYWLQGRRAEAKRAWEEARELARSEQERARIEEKLQQAY